MTALRWSDRSHALCWAGWSLAGLLALTTIMLAGGIAWINTAPGRAYVQRRVVQAVQSYVPGFSFARLGGFLPFTFALDVRLTDRFGLRTLRIAHIAADPQLLPLLRRRVVLEELGIDSPSLLLRPTRSGELNVSELLGRASRARNAAPPIWARTLHSEW